MAKKAVAKKAAKPKRFVDPVVVEFNKLVSVLKKAGIDTPPSRADFGSGRHGYQVSLWFGKQSIGTIGLIKKPDGTYSTNLDLHIWFKDLLAKGGFPLTERKKPAKKGFDPSTVFDDKGPDSAIREKRFEN